MPSAVDRAVSAARELRDLRARMMDATDGEEWPWTNPRIDLASDDATAEVRVGRGWGFSGSDLEALLRVAEDYGAGVSVVRSVHSLMANEAGLEAILRFQDPAP